MKKILLFIFFSFSLSSTSFTENVQKTKYFKGKEYIAKEVIDYKGEGSSKRTCTQFHSDIDFYYYCSSSSRESYSKAFKQDIGNFKKTDLIRYAITPNGKYKRSGFVVSNEDQVRGGGWMTKSGFIQYGLVDMKTNNWTIYMASDGTIKTPANLNFSYEKQKELIVFSKKLYAMALQVKAELDYLMGKTDQSSKSSSWQNDKKYSNKEKNRETDFKSYWWVAVIVAVLAFFIYTQTTKSISKSIPKTKRREEMSKQSDNVLVKFFRGEESLAFSYWVFYALLGGVLSFVITALEKSKAEDSVIGIVSLIVLAYYAYAMIGVWRSANNYKKEKLSKKEGYGWAIAAQASIVLSVIRMVVEIFKAFK